MPMKPTLEERVETLERDHAALEWMVIHLAKKGLLREPNPVAAAEILKEEAKEWAMNLIKAASEEDDNSFSNYAVGSAASASSLADQILEEVKGATG